MAYDPKRHVGRLIRLPAEYYRGRTFVHWSMAVQNRGIGWLDAHHHAVLRELLCHALGRYRLACPAYCLMPDHAHFLWLGFSNESDQRNAAKMFRVAWNRLLRISGRELQRQPFENVLSQHETTPPAISSVGYYILENPVRAQLVGSWKEYPFSGAVVPGYPDMEPRNEDFWEKFWRVYARLSAEIAGRGSREAFAE